MTELLKVCGFGLLSALCAMLVHTQHRESGKMVALCAGLMLMVFSVTHVQPVIHALQAFSEDAGLQNDTVALLIRLMAIAYTTEFASQACQDAGEKGLSMKVALAGKVILAGQTAPLLLQIGRTALAFLS